MAAATAARSDPLPTRLFQSRTRAQIKKGRQFTKLRIVPTQMYYDVESIRSRDDQLLTIMLMIFFELRGTAR